MKITPLHIMRIAIVKAEKAKSKPRTVGRGKPNKHPKIKQTSNG